MVITSFADGTTQDIFDGAESKAARRIPKSVWAVARRKLDLINAAHEPRDLMIPPGNRFEKLSGDRAGKYSVRVNDQFRIVFAFSDGNASDVLITDYH